MSRSNKQNQETNTPVVEEVETPETTVEEQESAESVEPEPTVTKVEQKPAEQKPAVGFGSVNKRIEEARNHTALNVTANETHEAVKATVGFDFDEAEDNSFLRNLILDLDDYVKVMNPFAPVTDKQALAQQMKLVRCINDALLQPVEVGVPALQIIEEYFKQHGRAAFSGSHPFRCFNEIPTRLQMYQDMVFAIQLIAQNGKKDALTKIAVARLKEACPNTDAQVVLLSYLNA